MKSALRLLLVLLTVIIFACALSACELPAGIDGFTIIFNTTTGATTTADPTATTAEPVTTEPVPGDPSTITTAPVTTAEITTVAPADPQEPKQIKKVTVAPTIDGVIDDAYRLSASYATVHQPVRGTGPDPYAMVDPVASAAMMEIMRGYMVTGATASSATFYFLWGEEAGNPYIYVAIEINDPTKYERTTAYTSNPNPWINDCLELHYHFGGSSAPSMYKQYSPYPVYNGVVRDSRTGSNLAAVGTEGYLTPTAVEAQKSLYFNQIKCAVSGRDTAGDTTYVIEYKIPARTESYTGKPTATGNFTRYAGNNLVAGDYVYFTYQINDLTGLPSGYTTTAQYDAKIATFGGAPKLQDKYTYAVPASSPWRAFEDAVSPYMYSAGNSRVGYLNAAGAAPMTLQLSSEIIE